MVEVKAQPIIEELADYIDPVLIACTVVNALKEEWGIEPTVQEAKDLWWQFNHYQLERLLNKEAKGMPEPEREES